MSGDSVFYENGLMPVDDNEYFSSKQWLYILDQNGGSYNSGFIQFDGSALANNSNYLNWSEAYFSIPVVVAVTNTGGIGAAPNAAGTGNDWFAALKNGYFQLINSMSCKLGGKDMLNLTPYLNQFVNYKLLTKFSTNDLQTLGDTLGFWPDTASSCNYDTQVATTNGSQNNNGTFGIITASGSNLGTTGNLGYFRRLLNNGYNPANADSINNIINSLASVAKATNKNYTEYRPNTNVAVPANSAQVYYIQAIIRLKDLSDLFDKLDMPMKGLYCQFQLNLNQGTVQVNNTATPAQGSISSVSIQGNTFPVMLNSATSASLIGASTCSIYCNVGTLTISGVNGSPFVGMQTSCRLYVPQYTMIASAERKYLESGKVKNIIYDDLQIFNVTSQAGQVVNQILTNGIANPKKLVICPSLNAASNGVFPNTPNTPLVSPLLSPYASEPATTSPVAVLSNMQVLLAGQSLFNNLIQYNYEFFLNETRPNSIMNGGLTDGISNGLIGELDWFYQYRYYVFNLSRYGKPESKNVPLSVQLQCQNLTNKILDLNCFITYERQVKIDISNGLVE